MIVYVFGNPDLESDALPLRLLPELRKRFSDLRFEVKDPHEEWEVSEELVMVDTVVGIDKPQVFTDLKYFVNSPRVSLHDFDVIAQLRLLEKLGKLGKIKIIGLPPDIPETEALEAVSKMLKT